MGQWQNNLFHGEGVYKKFNGTQLRGQFKDGVHIDGTMEGRGMACEGHWKDGVLVDGTGRMDFANGAVYNRRWKNGVFDGAGGTHTDDKGDRCGPSPGTPHRYPYSSHIPWEIESFLVSLCWSAWTPSRSCDPLGDGSWCDCQTWSRSAI